MSQRVNEFDQPIGEALADWQAAQFPKVDRMQGRYCDAEFIDSGRHACDLYKAYRQDTENKMWTYMSYGPFDSLEDTKQWLDAAAKLENQIFYALIDKRSGKAVGLASYMRIEPAQGVVEVGSISYSPSLQKTPVATEAMYLMMRHVFEEFGYRRYEWKCDSLNAASCRAAERLGFSYEGLFRQALIYKGRNRDTAWYSIIDKEWPAVKNAMEAWLDPQNFDANGQQQQSLADFFN